jgi:glyoxylase-like metal-dependent hydrolase (beta-lactamase superfamily II)
VHALAPVALEPDVEHALGQVAVLGVERDDGAQAESGAEHEQEREPVALAPAGVERGDEPPLLVLAERAGRRGAADGRAEQPGGIPGGKAGLGLERPEAPERRPQRVRRCRQALHTPGHCPGGVCLAIGRAEEDARELFVGDTLFAGSIGRTDLPGGDHAPLIHSIVDVLMRFPDATVVHAGHGPDTTIGRERATNPFLE